MRARVAVASALACGVALVVGLLLLDAFDGDDPAGIERGETGPPRMPALATADSRTDTQPSGSGACRIVGLVRWEGVPAAAEVEAYVIAFDAVLVDSVRRAAWTETQPAGRARAGDRGSFEIEGLDPGLYDVVARASDGRMGGTSASLAVPGGTASVEISLRGGPHALVGRVRRSDGAPWAGRVAADPSYPYADPALAWVATDPEGGFRIEGLERGRVRLHLTTAPDCRYTTTEIDIPRDGLYEVALPALAEHRGVVLDAMTRRPVGHARISLGTGTWPGSAHWFEVEVEARTDAEGRFVLEGPARGFFVTTAPGYATSWHRPERGEAEVRIDLSRCAVVRGTVTRAGDGRPAPGVAVFALDSDYDVAGSATTDAAGQYEISDMGPGEVSVVVYGKGWATPGLGKRRPGDVDPLALFVTAAEVARADRVVEPLATVRGRVLGSEGGGIRGAEVHWAIDPDSDADSPFAFLAESTVATSASDGSYMVSVLPDTVVVLSAITPLEFLERTEPVRAAPGETITADLRLAPGRFVSVSVVEADAAPVAGATVNVWTSTHSAWGLTGERGVVRVGPLPSGSLMASAYAHGYEREPEVRIAEEGMVQIRLVREREIAGRVVGPDGRAHADAYVVLRYGAEGSSGKGVAFDGTFRFDAVNEAPKTIHAVAQGDWRANHPLTTQPIDEHTRWVDIVLSSEQPTLPAKTVVRVVGPDGAPVASARVLSPGSGSTDVRNGVARLALPEERHVLVLEARSVTGAPLAFGACLHGPIPVDASEVVIRLPPERRISGTVRSSDKQPVAGAWVRAVPAPWPEPFALLASSMEELSGARTGVDGGFSIGGLWEGEYYLIVRASRGYGTSQPVLVPAGAVGAEVILPVATEVPVTVVDYDGRPVPRAVIRVAQDDVEYSATTDATGTARVVVGLPRPERAAWLEVTPPVTRPDLLPLEQTRWRQVMGTLRLERAAQVRGRVVDDSGAAVVGARVRALDASGRSDLESSGADGRFAFTSLRFGPVHLLAVDDADHKERWSRPVEVPPGSADVKLALEDAVLLRVVISDVPPGAEGVLMLRETTVGTVTAVAVASNGAQNLRVGPHVTYDAWLFMEHRTGTSQALVRGVAGRSGEVRMRVAPGGVASGRLLMPGSVHPELSLADEFPVPAFDVDAGAGTWLVRGLPPGRWEVRATGTDGEGAKYEGSAEVVPGSRIDLELRPK